jgi:hypothetical protein
MLDQGPNRANRHPHRWEVRQEAVADRERRERVGDGHRSGLAIVQAVTRAHRGTMTVTPASEGGLRIEVRRPPAPGKAAATLAVRDGDDAGHDAAAVGIPGV